MFRLWVTNCGPANFQGLYSGISIRALSKARIATERCAPAGQVNATQSPGRVHLSSLKLSLLPENSISSTDESRSTAPLALINEDSKFRRASFTVVPTPRTCSFLREMNPYIFTRPSDPFKVQKYTGRLPMLYKIGEVARTGLLSEADEKAACPPDCRRQV